MTWRVPPYDRALAALEAYVRAEFAPRGIIVSGSIVRREAGPTSDLDVFVIHDAPWRAREQRRFEGVPVELFINPPVQVRRYFAREHAEGRPCTAHMLATGAPLPPIDPIIADLIVEARDWLSEPLVVEPPALDSLRYGAVDLIDDARDTVAADPAAARLLLAAAVRRIIEYAFWRARRFQPRRKQAVTALAALDPAAAALVRRWQAAAGGDELTAVVALARHVLGVDTFFDWSSPREPVC